MRTSGSAAASLRAQCSPANPPPTITTCLPLPVCDSVTALVPSRAVVPRAGTLASSPLQLQQVHAIDVERLARTEYGNDDGQSHRGFGRSHHHHEKDEDVSIERFELRREGHEGQVHAVQHELNGKKDGNDVALDKKTGHAAGEEDRAQHEIVGKRNHQSALRCSLFAVRCSPEVRRLPFAIRLSPEVVTSPSLAKSE